MKTPQLAVAFGLLTLASGTMALIGAIDMGALVPFVLWFNAFAGAAYVAGSALLWRGSPLALPVALAILVATAVVFAAFGSRVASGGAYEMRTVGAMTLRTVFWAAMAWIAWTAAQGRRSA